MVVLLINNAINHAAIKAMFSTSSADENWRGESRLLQEELRQKVVTNSIDGSALVLSFICQAAGHGTRSLFWC
jgi:hypothetical protein